MALRCKVGDLAIICPVEDHEYSGMLVEVLRLTSGELDHSPDGKCWRIVFNPSWFVRSLSGAGFGHANGTSQFCPWADSSLRPIRPDAEPDSVTTTRELAEQ